jgi:hypothetical protein
MNTTKTTVVRFEEPLDASSGDACKHGFDPFFMLGLINPFGPTLGILGVDGKLVPGKELPVLWITFNPFSQTCEQVGTLKIGPEWNPSKDLATFCETGFGGTPTLLATGKCIPEPQAEQLLVQCLTLTPWGATILDKVRQFPGSPWDRITAEVGEVDEMMKVPKESRIRRPMTKTEAIEFVELQLNDAHMRAEIAALMVAWQGSIELVGSVNGVMQWSDFLETFDELAESCRLL